MRKLVSARTALANVAMFFGGLLAACGGTSGPSEAGAGGAGASPVATTRPEGVALCYSALAETLPETKAFWTALSAGDKAGRAKVLEDLEAAVAAHPEEEELALLLGLGSLWRVAEPLEAEAKDQAGFVKAALAAKSNVEKAYQLCPTDYRIPAWLGPILVNMGRAIGDQKSVDEGLAVLQQGIDHYPSFVLFSKLLVFADRPTSDPDFQKALDAVKANVGACGDILTSTDPACRNGEHTPHNIEGGSLFLGDVYVKAGLRDEAKKVFEDAKKGAGYATWPYASLLDERLANLDARVAAFADGDPKNDPESMWSSDKQCAVCHYAK